MEIRNKNSLLNQSFLEPNSVAGGEEVDLAVNTW